MGARSSNELQWLLLKIEHQDNSPSNGHQGDMPYCPLISIKHKPCVNCFGAILISTQATVKSIFLPIPHVIEMHMRGFILLGWYIEAWRKWLMCCRQHFQMHFNKVNFCILLQFSLKCLLKGTFDNKTSLVKVIARCRTGNKPLP